MYTNGTYESTWMSKFYDPESDASKLSERVDGPTGLIANSAIEPYRNNENKIVVWKMFVLPLGSNSPDVYCPCNLIVKSQKKQIRNKSAKVAEKDLDLVCAAIKPCGFKMRLDGVRMLWEGRMRYYREHKELFASQPERNTLKMSIIYKCITYACPLLTLFISNNCMYGKLTCKSFNCRTCSVGPQVLSVLPSHANQIHIMDSEAFKEFNDDRNQVNRLNAFLTQDETNIDHDATEVFEELYDDDMLLEIPDAAIQLYDDAPPLPNLNLPISTLYPTPSPSQVSDITIIDDKDAQQYKYYAEYNESSQNRPKMPLKKRMAPTGKTNMESVLKMPRL